MRKHVVLLLLALWMGGMPGRAADAPAYQALVARELPSVVSISILRSPAPVAMLLHPMPRSGQRRRVAAGFSVPASLSIPAGSSLPTGT